MDGRGFSEHKKSDAFRYLHQQIPSSSWSEDCPCREGPSNDLRGDERLLMCVCFVAGLILIVLLSEWRVNPRPSLWNKNASQL